MEEAVKSAGAESLLSDREVTTTATTAGGVTVLFLGNRILI